MPPTTLHSNEVNSNYGEFKKIDTFARPVGAVSNRTGLECRINSKVHYRSVT